MAEGGGVVCCMCGDVGFSDKLFRCSNCRNRFQHSYCSNYYYYSSRERERENRKEDIEECDWCHLEKEEEGKSGRSWSSSPAAGNYSKAAAANANAESVKLTSAHKVTGKVPSTTRKYKLLKDVMCYST